MTKSQLLTLFMFLDQLNKNPIQVAAGFSLRKHCFIFAPLNRSLSPFEFSDKLVGFKAPTKFSSLH